MDRSDAVFRSTREQSRAETVLSSGLEARRASWRMAQYRLLVTSVHAHFRFVMRCINKLLDTGRPINYSKNNTTKNDENKRGRILKSK